MPPGGALPASRCAPGHEWRGFISECPGSRRVVRPSCEHVFVSYVELHCHSAFSFLDGASSPDEIAAAAVSHGYEALALTDHNSVSGSMEFAIS
ncbi:MAG TPA: PHP domain-containing protein, partial [Solirubrobacteraceae bacterium]|nr:PHP domain-containing protein [Solirubrobacteraceae bacterium]